MGHAHKLDMKNDILWKEKYLTFLEICAMKHSFLFMSYLVEFYDCLKIAPWFLNAFHSSITREDSNNFSLLRTLNEYNKDSLKC